MTVGEPQAPLSIARYGEVMAHVIHFRREPRGAVLAAIGVAEDDWELSDTAWKKALVDEAIEDERPVNAAFSAALTPVLVRLKAERPALDTLVPLPSDARPAPVIVAPLPPAPVAPPPAPAPREEQVAAEQEVPAPAQRDVVSLVPEGMRHFIDLRGTNLQSSFVAAPALPFRPESAVSPTKPVAPPLVPLDVARAAPATAPSSAKERLAGTSLALDIPALGPALPFGVERPPDVPVLSLEQYASLCVELGDPRQPQETTLLRYRLNAGQRAKLDEHWSQRMAREPALRSAWERACTGYREWLVQSAAARRPPSPVDPKKP